MKKIFLSALAITALSATQSCHTDFDRDVKDMAMTSGDANFSKYVALGNSLTSGYRDNALYSDGQNESYPSMIAQQMKLLGGGDFKQPMMPNNTGGFSNFKDAAGNFLFPGKMVLSVVNGSLSPAPTAPMAALDNISAAGPYQNMGVPGAKSFHLVAPGYGNAAGLATGKANPYFVRFASSASTSVLADALAQKPTFFSLWIGNNDVLSYATSGGSGKDQKGNTDPATYGGNDITDPNVVAGSIQAVLEGMKSVGATKGVIANIPNVTAIPYFTTVPYNPLTAAAIGKGNAANGEAAIANINKNLYGPLKQALAAFGAGDRINLLSTTAANPVLIKDLALPNLSAQLTAALTPALGAATAAAFGQIYGQARQATPSDYILLGTRAVIGSTATGVPENVNVYGISYPLENQHVLTASEASLVKSAVDAYNASIAQLASKYGLALVDANSKMAQISTMSGLQYNGVKFTANYITGGTFSLDGVHLTGRGYGMIANEFIKAINATYHSTLPQVNANAYSGVTFP